MNGPFRIRLSSRVRSAMPHAFPGAASAGECDAWCNDHGAVVVKDDRGENLGVRPHEFEYITLPPEGLPLAVTPEGARALADRLIADVEGVRYEQEALNLKGHDVYLSESAECWADPTGVVCEDAIGRIAIEHDRGDPSVGIGGWYHWAFVPRSGVMLLPTDVFDELREVCGVQRPAELREPADLAALPKWASQYIADLEEAVADVVALGRSSGGDGGGAPVIASSDGGCADASASGLASGSSSFARSARPIADASGSDSGGDDQEVDERAETAGQRGARTRTSRRRA